MTKVSKWLVIWGCWTLIALFFTAQVIERGPLYPTGNLELVARNLISAYIWFILTPIVISLARRFPISYASWRSSAIVHVIAGGMLTVIHVAIFTLILWTTGLIVIQDGYVERFQRILAFNFNSDVAFYLLIFGITLALDAYRRRRLVEAAVGSEAESEAEPQASEIESWAAQDETSARPEDGTREKLTRIPIKGSGRITFVETDEIDWLEADDNYVRLHLGGKSHLIREKIGRIEAELDRSQFLRIHRSIIVNTNRIKELRPLPGSIFEVVLKDGRVVRSGRRYRANFSPLLGE